MSPRRKGVRNNHEKGLDLKVIIKYLKIIAAMAGALLIVGVIGFIFSDKGPETNVVYALIIGFNLLVVLGVLIIPRIFSKVYKDINEDHED